MRTTPDGVIVDTILEQKERPFMGWKLTQVVGAQFLRSRMSMRFHPKRRASIDQPPGPSSARAAPRVPSRIQLHGFPGCEKACHSARIATSTPAIGVHNPASKSIPPPIANTGSMAAPLKVPLRSDITPSRTNAIPATSLIKRRPAPGKP